MWHKRTALREFLRTETGSALVLATATVAALVSANLSVSYLRPGVGHPAVGAGRRGGRDGERARVREFRADGAFSLVVGLEARREFDVGELRVRSRLALPVAVGLGGMIFPIGISLVVNAEQATAHAWGASMSTDTAFALARWPWSAGGYATGSGPTC